MVDTIDIFENPEYHEYITKAELARRAHVSHPAISQACKKKLFPAMYGNKIDAKHEVVIQYLKKNNPGEGEEAPDPYVRGRDAEKEAKKINSDGKIIEIPKNIEEFANMSLRELINKFGTDVRFVDWLRATKTIEDINEKRLKNAVTVGELINKELIKTLVLEPINAAHTKLLSAGSKTLAIRIKAKVEAGSSTYEIEQFIIEHIQSFIKPMKAKIIKSLKKC